MGNSRNNSRAVAEATGDARLLAARLAVHIRAEHLCLFPAVLDAARRSQTNAGGATRLAEAEAVISRLKRDHDFFMREMAGAVKTMRELRSAQDSAAAEELLRGVRQTISAVKARLERAQPPGGGGGLSLARSRARLGRAGAASPMRAARDQESATAFYQSRAGRERPPDCGVRNMLKIEAMTK